MLAHSCQVEEVVGSASFSRGDLRAALRESLLALDDRMREADSREELAGYTEKGTG